MRIARFGWKPDLPDHRDLKLARPHSDVITPPKADLREQCPPVVDQGDLGSCTANAIACALLFAGMQQGEAPVELSRLFIYYNERVMEGSVNEDSGAQIRDGIKSVVDQGACLELAWPYNIERFMDKPDSVAYFDAKQRRAVKYLRVDQSEHAVEACLAAGFPVVFGFTVYESFEAPEVAGTGIVPMPGLSEQPIGGHAVTLVGYDKAARTFLVRNSWGPGWGQQGYFTMPYAYVLSSDLADDFWTIREVAPV